MDINAHEMLPVVPCVPDGLEPVRWKVGDVDFVRYFSKENWAEEVGEYIEERFTTQNTSDCSITYQVALPGGILALFKCSKAFIDGPVLILSHNGAIVAAFPAGEWRSVVLVEGEDKEVGDGSN